jgi:hypothetical protein
MIVPRFGGCRYSCTYKVLGNGWRAILPGDLFVCCLHEPDKDWFQGGEDRIMSPTISAAIKSNFTVRKDMMLSAPVLLTQGARCGLGVTPKGQHIRSSETVYGSIQDKLDDMRTRSIYQVFP